jgi:xanthine dehydrogenase accessory factor
MAIRRDGNHLGTIGGGCGEAQVIQAGLQVIDTGTPTLVRVDLTEDVGYDAEAACGGAMEVLVAPCDGTFLPVLDLAAQAILARQCLELATVISPLPLGGSMLAISGDRHAFAAISEEEARSLLNELARQENCPGSLTEKTCVSSVGKAWEILHERISPSPELLICGGGHIALPLSRIAEMLGFRVVIIDDRPSYANPERFPHAHEVICAPFAHALSQRSMDQGTFAVVVTRGHRHDLECVRHLLGQGTGYLGMIGSRRRVQGVFDLLRKEGRSAKALSELHSPIGLDIGAETPAEIAVAILAEIIKTMRGGSGRSMGLSPKKGANTPSCDGHQGVES